jgi:5-methyltetrahydrofolate--homocysteine methyltransferase
MIDYSQLTQAVTNGEWKKTAAMTQELLAAGAKPEDIIAQSLQAGMEVVGEKYSSGEFYLPDMLKASRAMNAAMETLKPLVEDAKITKLGKVVIATVKNDMHDIGKNIVTSFMKGVGFDVIDLGVDASPEKFAETVRHEKPDIVALSALLTTTMYEIGNVVKKLQAEGLRDQVKIMAGGAPVTERFALQMGADAYAQDGGEAIRVAKRLMGR